MVRFERWVQRLRFSGRVLGMAGLLVAGGLMAAPAHAAKDVVQFGNEIKVARDSSIHDAVCFFCGLKAVGDVNGDIVVFFGSVRIDSRANHDVVVFFGDVTAADDAAIGGSVVNFFGSTKLGENVSVRSDTVVMFGSLDAASTSSIGGDRVVQPGWIFWVPFLLIAFGISFLVREFRGQRRRRMLRGY